MASCRLPVSLGCPELHAALLPAGLGPLLSRPIGCAVLGLPCQGLYLLGCLGQPKRDPEGLKGQSLLTGPPGQLI